MKWQFEEFPKSLVETEVTQRDQFRNDDVDLADTLVRETVQNSLDARAGKGRSGQEAVRVRFAFLDGDNAPNREYVRQLFDQEYRNHAEAAGIELGRIDFEHPRAIVIEDFGTNGLLGNPWEKGDDDFSDFWRRHGISHKSGERRGRWGLGKLVFSISSLLRAFFGLTVRAGDKTPFLMGQTVLSMHKLGNRQYPAHTHFSEVSQDAANRGLRIPITDSSLVNRFSEVFRLKRGGMPGLSLVIPFPHEDLQRERIIEAAIRHYFIPILRGQLVLEFDDLVLDKTNLKDRASQYLKHGSIRDMEALFSFVLEAENPETQLISIGDRWYRDGLEQAFQPDELEKLRRSFADGKLVSVRFPIDIVRKDGMTERTEVRGYLKKPAQLSRGQDYYVRSGITVPQESKFGHRNALGLLIADDPIISAFLGDAENPAHTLWIGNAEKVQMNYRGARERVTAIKKCLLNLHDLLAQAVEEKAEEALLDFFWTPGTGARPRREKGEKTLSPATPPATKPELFRIGPIDGGFTVHPGEGLTADRLPLTASIEVAYDVEEGNPFRFWSEHDFDFTKKGDARIEIQDVKDFDAKSNIIKCTFTKAESKISVTGLDSNRDLIIKVEVEEKQ